MSSLSSRFVGVVTGLGGMGQQIARHIAPGTQLVLADFNPTNLKHARSANAGRRLRADSFGWLMFRSVKR